VNRPVQTARLVDVLQGIASEVDRLSSLTAPIEDAFETLHKTGSDLRDLRHVLQGFDLHAQSTDALARLLRTLSAELSDTQVIDAELAIAQIPLRDMADRLTLALKVDGDTCRNDLSNRRDIAQKGPPVELF
tara:strand:- start:2477 stop:2872 length:396 start_codon:yes stop_codon:yes gene_type:complete